MSEDWRLRRRGNGYWYAVPSAEHRKRGAKPQSLATRDRAEAERRLLDALKAPQGETLTAIMDAYLREKDATAVAADRLRYAWDRAKPVFGELRPDHITRDLCRRYRKRRKVDGVSDATIKKELETIRAGLRWANKHHEAQFEIPPGTPPKDRYLTREEAERLRDAARESHVLIFIEIALGTGARAGAVLDLTWDRVDLGGRRIRFSREVSEKRKKRALVPINDRLHGVLKSAAEARTIDHVIEYGGKPVKSIKRGFRNACERAGLDDVTPHVLRHTVAVWLAEDGVPMSEIAQFLGHSDSRVTERVYARYSPEYLSKAAKALE